MGAIQRVLCSAVLLLALAAASGGSSTRGGKEREYRVSLTKLSGFTLSSLLYSYSVERGKQPGKDQLVFRCVEEEQKVFSDVVKMCNNQFYWPKPNKKTSSRAGDENTEREEYANLLLQRYLILSPNDAAVTLSMGQGPDRKTISKKHAFIRNYVRYATDYKEFNHSAANTWNSLYRVLSLTSRGKVPSQSVPSFTRTTSRNLSLINKLFEDRTVAEYVRILFKARTSALSTLTPVLARDIDGGKKLCLTVGESTEMEKAAAATLTVDDLMRIKHVVIKRLGDKRVADLGYVINLLPCDLSVELRTVRGSEGKELGDMQYRNSILSLLKGKRLHGLVLNNLTDVPDNIKAFLLEQPLKTFGCLGLCFDEAGKERDDIPMLSKVRSSSHLVLPLKVMMELCVKTSAQTLEVTVDSSLTDKDKRNGLEYLKTYGSIKKVVVRDGGTIGISPATCLRHLPAVEELCLKNSGSTRDFESVAKTLLARQEKKLETSFSLFSKLKSLTLTYLLDKDNGHIMSFLRETKGKKRLKALLPRLEHLHIVLESNPENTEPRTHAVINGLWHVFMLVGKNYGYTLKVSLKIDGTDLTEKIRVKHFDILRYILKHGLEDPSEAELKDISSFRKFIPRIGGTVEEEGEEGE